MAIIGNGFDDQSFSSEDTYNHVFTDTEAATVKGLYFQRAQLLRPGASGWSLDPCQQALINVGGIRYAYPWSTLEDIPQSRLSRLRFCTTLKEIAEVCDDYDEMRHEFFFDRDPLAFRAIHNYLAKGKLRLLQEVCDVSLHGELVYWGIDIPLMEPCCRRGLMSSVEEATAHQLKEEEWRQARRRRLRALVVEDSLFHMLGEAVENPHSGLAGKVFAFLSVIMVVITVVSLCISTMPDPQHQQQEEATVRMNRRNLFILSWIQVKIQSTTQILSPPGQSGSGPLCMLLGLWESGSRCAGGWGSSADGKMRIIPVFCSRTLLCPLFITRVGPVWKESASGCTLFGGAMLASQSSNPPIWQRFPFVLKNYENLLADLKLAQDRHSITVS